MYKKLKIKYKLNKLNKTDLENINEELKKDLYETRNTLLKSDAYSNMININSIYYGYEKALSVAIEIVDKKDKNKLKEYDDFLNISNEKEIELLTEKAKWEDIFLENFIGQAIIQQYIQNLIDGIGGITLNNFEKETLQMMEDYLKKYYEGNFKGVNYGLINIEDSMEEMLDIITKSEKVIINNRKLNKLYEENYFYIQYMF